MPVVVLGDEFKGLNLLYIYMYVPVSALCVLPCGCDWRVACRETHEALVRNHDRYPIVGAVTSCCVGAYVSRFSQNDPSHMDNLCP